MKKTLTAGLAVAALAVLPATAAVADSHGLPDVEVQTVDVPTSDDAAQVVVVHGVPGLEVDILAGGDAVIEGFNYRDIEVLELPGGSYDLAVAAAGTTDAVLELTAEVEEGVSYTVAAFLDADGNPTIDAFANETDATGIQPFHLAAFGPVSIIAGGEILLDDVANGDTARIDVEGGTTVEGVGIGVAGSADAAIELGDVEVPANTLVLAYAIGPEAPAEDADDDAADDAAEDADEGERPEAVHSGTGGAATDTLPLSVLALMAIGVLAIAAPVAATVTKRRR